MQLIILLGNTNDGNGELSEISKARCAVAITTVKKQSTARILPTGGFGDHFNSSNAAHWRYLVKYLLSNGISPNSIITPQESSNTLEDALMSRRIAVLQKAASVSIVTSAFHLDRVRYIFERLFPDFHLEFLVAEDNSSPSVIEGLRQHELKSLDAIKREWVMIPLFDGKEFPRDIYGNAEKEQKHYDQISWIAMTGLLGAAGFLINHSHELYVSNASIFYRLVYFFVGVYFLFLLWNIYNRSAQTARTARRILSRIEIGYGQRGFSSSYQSQHFAFSQFSIRAITVLILIGAIFSLGLLLLM